MISPKPVGTAAGVGREVIGLGKLGQFWDGWGWDQHVKVGKSPTQSRDHDDGLMG